MAEVQPTIECGFCLRKNEALPQPKTLPCTHVHCMDCLVGYYQENNLLLCPVQDCGEVFDGSPDTLPSYDMEGDSKWCDVCVKKNMTKQEAVIYCTVCCKKYCDTHQQYHDDVLDNHSMISLQEYRAQASKLQTRYCTEHKNQTYILGCKICSTVACVRCVPELGVCDNGASHSLMPLEDLVAALMQGDISADMMAKEEQYERLFKVTSKARVEYDNKTTEMVQLIHQVRDVQIDALKLKYKKLEDEVVEKRQKSRVDLAEFMEDIVLKKWTQLRNHRKMAESRVKCNHQVDVVKGIKELKEQMLKFVEEELPKLQLADELELRELGESRLMELEIASSDDLVIDSEQGVTTLQPLPQSVTLLKSVQLPSYPISVCQYNGNTYVGLENNAVSRIDNNYQLYNSFISTSGPVESISVYKDRFYTLSYANPRVVNVYDVSGGHITSWNHPCGGWYCNMLTVVADQVVVADPTNRRITIYSLTGESLRHIPCPLLTDIYIAMCAVENTSVVISNYGTSKVFRVNITTGDVMWTFSDVNYPQGVVRYGRYILLAAYNNKTIYILNTTTDGQLAFLVSEPVMLLPVCKSVWVFYLPSCIHLTLGKIVSEVADGSIAGGHVFGLEVYDTTLVVPKFDSQQTLFYQLNKS